MLCMGLACYKLNSCISYVCIPLIKTPKKKNKTNREPIELEYEDTTIYIRECLC